MPNDGMEVAVTFVDHEKAMNPRSEGAQVGSCKLSE
jgi:hypothetical protein